MSVKSFLKRLVLPTGKAPRTIRGGVLAGLRMELDFAHHTQHWLGLQERELVPWFDEFSQGIKTAFDVGANEGIYSLYFLARTPVQRVLAFEPAAENLPRIRRTLELNQLGDDPRLRVFQKFVGRSSGGDWVHLDAFVDELATPCLMKVDIDGGEVDLLRGAQKILATPGVRWIIEVHSVELERKCLEILREAGYRTTIVPNAWWRRFLPEQRPVGHNRWVVATRENLDN
jgi:hypothetical protein